MKIDGLKRSKIPGSNKTRDEEFSGNKPDLLSYIFLPYFQPVMYNIPKDVRKGTFDAKAYAGMYVGGDVTNPGCIQVYSFKAKRVIEGVDTYRVLNEVPTPWKPFPRQYFVPDDADDVAVEVNLDDSGHMTRAKAARNEQVRQARDEMGLKEGGVEDNPDVVVATDTSKSDSTTPDTEKPDELLNVLKSDDVSSVVPKEPTLPNSATHIRFSDEEKSLFDDDVDTGSNDLEGEKADITAAAAAIISDKSRRSDRLAVVPKVNYDDDASLSRHKVSSLKILRPLRGHLRRDSVVLIEKSTLDNARNGLFARKDIPSRSFMCDYTGTTYPSVEQVPESDRSNPYLWLLKDGQVIIGDPKQCYGAYINDPLDHHCRILGISVPILPVVEV